MRSASTGRSHREVTATAFASPPTVMPATRPGAGHDVAKRMLDVAVSSVGLVTLAPLFAVLAIAIRLDSPGPAIFRQTRIGKDCLPFTFYKFRTMTVDNDPAAHQQYVTKLITEGSEDLRAEDGSYKLKSDARVTRLGRILRRTSIDELPQLYNVLKGDMSLVGPRPPLDYEVRLYDERCMGRLACKPGITGLWQVSGRCKTTFDEMIDLDLEYVERRSIWMDLRILFRTIGVVFGREGAW